MRLRSSRTNDVDGSTTAYMERRARVATIGRMPISEASKSWRVGRTNESLYTQRGTAPSHISLAQGRFPSPNVAASTDAELEVVRKGMLFETLRARARGDSPPALPSRVTVKITGRCNLRCDFCEIGRSHGGSELPYEAILRLLSFAREYGLRVFLWGGEPFVHSRIWDVLTHCEHVGQRVSIVTNGTVLASLSEERQRLLNRCISMMSLSIDAAAERDHDSVRGVPGTFRRASTYLRSPGRSHSLGLNTVLAVDFSNAREMIQFAHDNNTSVNFQPIIFETNFPELERRTWKDRARERMGEMASNRHVLEEALEFARAKRVGTNLRLVLFYIEAYYSNAGGEEYFFDELLPDFHCYTPSNALVVDERGRIMPCTLVQGEADIFQDDWLQTWRDQADRFRRDWAAGRRPSACRSCSCHFAENLRCNVLARPLVNRRQIGWLSAYSATRWLAGEGRIQ